MSADVPLCASGPTTCVKVLGLSFATALLILGFTLLGLVFSGWSALVHYRLLTQPSYASPCNSNTIFNCSEAYLSRFGSVGGVSVAVLGIILFEIVALLAGLGYARSNDGRDPTASYIFAMSTVGVAATLYLAWASWFVLNRWCVLCLGTYVSAVGLFVVSGLTISVPLSELPRQLMNDVVTLTHHPVGFISALVAIAIAVGLISWFPRESVAIGVTDAAPESAGVGPNGIGSTGEQAKFEEIWRGRPRLNLAIPADGARVVVVTFIDWQCGSCRSAYLAHEPILAKYEEAHPGAVKSVTKDYPLSSRCNFKIRPRGHAAACEAAAAVRLAAERGQEKEMINWLFQNQTTLTPQSVEAEVVRRLGLTNFSYEYARVLPGIQRDIAEASALGVEETPTYYVNGSLAQTPGAAYLDPTHLDWAIQCELKSP